MASSAASSATATIVYQDGDREETLVRPPEYKDQGLIEKMYENGIHVGFDASILCDGDIVFCAQGEEKGIYTIDYWFASNTLKFHTGELSIVPICQTAWKRSDCETEYLNLLAHNLILLRGGEGHPNRMGPVASCIARLCRKWKQQRTEAKRTREEGEGEPEAKRRRREGPERPVPPAIRGEDADLALRQAQLSVQFGTTNEAAKAKRFAKFLRAKMCAR